MFFNPGNVSNSVVDIISIISPLLSDAAFDIINNKISRVICGKIIDITNELNLDSIAEGIETKEQLELLKELGCKVIQGFYISSALPKHEAVELLSKGRIINGI